MVPEWFPVGGVMSLVKVAPLVGLTVACSLTQFEISAPARADSIACAKAVLTELGYRIYREDANEQELAAVYRTRFGVRPIR